MGSRASRRRTGGIVGLAAVAHELGAGTAQRIIIFDRHFRVRSKLRKEVLFSQQQGELPLRVGLRTYPYCHH